MPAEPRIAEFDRLRIQVQTADVEATFGQRVKQTARPASRLEQSLRLATHQSAATAKDELNLRRAVGTKDKVIVFGVIVDRFAERFDPG